MNLLACERNNSTATPGCNCRYCTAVFQEWAEQAEGFHNWMHGLSDAKLKEYFGLEREKVEDGDH